MPRLAPTVASLEAAYRLAIRNGWLGRAQQALDKLEKLREAEACDK